MECTIAHKNVKLFAAGVQCLSRIGKEAVLEAKKTDGTGSLAMHAMNDANSSLTKFTFYNSFFERFMLDGLATRMRMVVKVPLKAFLSVFKSIRSTERLTISFVNEGPRHVIRLSSQCKGGLVKTHELHYEDSNAVMAKFDRRTARHQIIARTNIFQTAFSRVSGSEEVSLTVFQDKGLTIASHFQHADQETEYTTLKSKINISMEDLNKFENATEKPAEILFGLREIKALLQFCEQAEVVQMCLMFHKTGEPLLFTTEPLGEEEAVSGDNALMTSGGMINTFRAELYMATLEVELVEPDEAEEQTYHSQSSSATKNSSSTKAIGRVEKNDAIPAVVCSQSSGSTQSSREIIPPKSRVTAPKRGNTSQSTVSEKGYTSSSSDGDSDRDGSQSTIEPRLVKARRLH